MTYRGIKVDYEKVEEHFKDPYNFITTVIPDLILREKSRIFTRDTKLDGYEDLIQIKIKTGIVNASARQINYALTERGRGDDEPSVWVKIKYKSKVIPKLKATAYFVIPFLGLFRYIDAIYLHPTGKPSEVISYPISEYAKHEGMDVDTIPYDDDDIVVMCNNVFDNYFYYDYCVELISIANKIKQLKDSKQSPSPEYGEELDKLHESYSTLYDRLRIQVNALVCKIYTVSALICHQLLDIPISQVFPELKDEKPYKDDTKEDNQSRRRRYSKQQFNRKVLERIM